MRRLAIAGLSFLACLAALLAGRESHGQRFVVQPDSAYPRLKFADSLVSLNDRCIVARSRLNLRVRPVYVSGQPIGFC